MTHDNDEKLARLLCLHAPAERDPFFRLRVLERRERQRYRQRSMRLAAAVLACVVFFAVVVKTEAGLFNSAVVLVFGVGVLIAGFLCISSMAQLLRGFGSLNQAAKKI